MYDPERGGFVDLSVLDVLQIFGRAGRPQYDSSGHAVLITQQKTLYSYLGLLAQQTPIESAMTKALIDHLNAEIVNGTVNNVKEAVVWLSYTFLFVRMKRNPLAYGLKHEDLFSDPQLEQKRLELVVSAAETLDACMMARYDRRSGNLAVTDLGRIASHFYIKHDTIEAFNRMLSPHLMHPEALHLLCSSSEFDQLKVRPEELTEIDGLKKHVFVKVKGGPDDTASKVNVLLQAYLSQSKINSFTLQSDCNYVAQNASRIARALFEICLKRGWATLAQYYLTLCRCLERRMRMDQTPLRQFAFDQAIPKEVFKRLEETQTNVQTLLDLQDKEIGQLVHNHKLGGKLKQLAGQLPALHVESVVQPITKGILRIKLSVHAQFQWVDRYHGGAEPFWIWIEDSENEYVYHAEHFVLLKKTREEVKLIEVVIPVREPLPSQYFVRVMSDMWVGCDNVFPLPFDQISMPRSYSQTHTTLLDLHPLPKSALRNPAFEALFSFTHFNPVQTQAFHTLYHTDRNVLVGAPTGTTFIPFTISRQYLVYSMFVIS
jgi:activating signal cointegrator complex subunit 3